MISYDICHCIWLPSLRQIKSKTYTNHFYFIISIILLCKMLREIRYKLLLNKNLWNAIVMMKMRPVSWTAVLGHIGRPIVKLGASNPSVLIIRLFNFWPNKCFSFVLFAGLSHDSRHNHLLPIKTSFIFFLKHNSSLFKKFQMKVICWKFIFTAFHLQYILILFK